MLFECRDVTFAYTLGRQKYPALNSITLDIAKGDMVCLSGPSGSGKSTLLNLLGLIEPLPQGGGSICFDGTEFSDLTEREKNHIRRFRLGFVFQSFHLLEVLRADENVEYFLARQGMAREDRGQRTSEALKAVGLWEHRRKRPLEMSGGQRQRVAIARALAKRPDVIIADEPTASLDQHTGRDIVGLLDELNRERGVTVVMASHDPMVMQLSRRIIRLVDGRLVAAPGET